jgi:FHS family L-fucose permease-like MFS transporter
VAILGGALLPLVQGTLMNTLGAALAFIVPAICLTLVAYYALFDLRTARHRGAHASEGAAL